MGAERVLATTSLCSVEALTLSRPLLIESLEVVSGLEVGGGVGIIVAALVTRCNRVSFVGGGVRIGFVYTVLYLDALTLTRSAIVISFF